MRKHRVARVVVLVAVIAATAVLVPTPVAAHAHVERYRPPHEFALPQMGTLQTLPVLNRGTAVALLADRDLERFHALIGRS